ncbi:hypothetical protein [Bradyrhizobium sp. 17]|uniref:hypothetical protein n=1 Tax=Bradyrhizobium sp. 17 TaxID=2782649 RepID=UPI001FF8F4E0|nr:hypothetical protein [Bradyrhizobium sp. 17]MCK1520464.1 hypothetical protein [Bradyrhizobium sp. 17]
MNNPILQKHFGDIAGLKAHKFFTDTGLMADLRAGNVFPAVRKEEVHFYYGGARLCVYKTGRVYTNNRYLKISDNGQSRDVAIPKEWFTCESYESIKENCRTYRPVEGELPVVSQLFPMFSLAADRLPDNQARLIDIECRFPGTPKTKTAQDMIDCLFITAGGTLVFVEVKLSSNKEARSDGKREPKVASQLQRYRSQFGSKPLRDEITKVYTGVNATILELMGSEVRQHLVPKRLFQSVPLLIVGKKASVSPQGKEAWQGQLLATSLDLKAEIIGLDGRSEKMCSALCDFFSTLDRDSTEATL